MSFLGEDIKKLGFGLMRLPMVGDDVDIEQTKSMTDLFLEKGFRYFDTAFGYLDGKSELAVKEALTDRYPRESFLLATKLPAWAAKSEQEAKQMLFTSLERTGAGYFDFYLLHNLGVGRTEVFDKFGLWDFIEEQKKNGLIKHIGFSFHDKAEILDKLLDEHPEVEFVQLQINYADWESETVQSRKCYETAVKHGKPVIVMEPVKGGSLARLPENAEALLKNVNESASISSWGIRFAASLDSAAIVLSGMSSIEQMRDNVSYMENFEPLSESELAAVDEVSGILDGIPRIPCTECGYCVKGCPQSINIYGVFKGMNNYLIYDNLAGAKSNYSFATMNGAKASDCIECGQCESVCPQQIHIIDELKRAAQTLE